MNTKKITKITGLILLCSMITACSSNSKNTGSVSNSKSVIESPIFKIYGDELKQIDDEYIRIPQISEEDEGVISEPDNVDLLGENITKETIFIGDKLIQSIEYGYDNRGRKKETKVINYDDEGNGKLFELITYTYYRDGYDKYEEYPGASVKQSNLIRYNNEGNEIFFRREYDGNITETVSHMKKNDDGEIYTYTRNIASEKGAFVIIEKFDDKGNLIENKHISDADIIRENVYDEGNLRINTIKYEYNYDGDLLIEKKHISSNSKEIYRYEYDNEVLTAEINFYQINNMNTYACRKQYTYDENGRLIETLIYSPEITEDTDISELEKAINGNTSTGKITRTVCTY